MVVHCESEVWILACLVGHSFFFSFSSSPCWDSVAIVAGRHFDRAKRNVTGRSKSVRGPITGLVSLSTTTADMLHYSGKIPRVRIFSTTHFPLPKTLCVHSKFVFFLCVVFKLPLVILPYKSIEWSILLQMNRVYIFIALLFLVSLLVFFYDELFFTPATWFQGPVNYDKERWDYLMILVVIPR